MQLFGKKAYDGEGAENAPDVEVNIDKRDSTALLTATEAFVNAQKRFANGQGTIADVLGASNSEFDSIIKNFPAILNTYDKNTGKLIRSVTKEQALLSNYNSCVSSFFKPRTAIGTLIQKMQAGRKAAPQMVTKAQLERFRKLNDQTINQINNNPALSLSLIHI